MQLDGEGVHRRGSPGTSTGRIGLKTFGEGGGITRDVFTEAGRTSGRLPKPIQEIIHASEDDLIDFTERLSSECSDKPL